MDDFLRDKSVLRKEGSIRVGEIIFLVLMNLFKNCLIAVINQSEAIHQFDSFCVSGKEFWHFFE